MYEKALQTLLTQFIVVTIAFEDMFYVYSQVNQEVMEHGREQYQLLKERSALPKYGPCWKAAVGHLDEGCRHLSEETQSDIALRITNCFLEMSGHETYDCHQDIKPNVRAICVNTMSDRAFNVYTEFYTHTQNICWFLRGQIWHEAIAENTLKVGKQLEVTTQNQEDLLKAQQSSLELQERMLKHGRFLEKVLEDLYISSQSHQEILMVLSNGIANLQTWIVGEISWIDSIIFYVTTVFIAFIVTSAQRTMSARLPVFFLLFLNFVAERLICSVILLKTNSDRQSVYNDVYNFTWYSRYLFTFLSSVFLIYRTITHKDLVKRNNELLGDIREQNNDILDILRSLKNVLIPSKDNINIINESLNRKSLDKLSYDDYSYASSSYKRNSYSNTVNDYKEGSAESSKENNLNNSSYYSSSKKRLHPLNELQNSRYNLRSRQNTPDVAL